MFLELAEVGLSFIIIQGCYVDILATLISIFGQQETFIKRRSRTVFYRMLDTCT